MRRISLLAVSLIFAFYGCQKDERITSDPNAKLNFSKDSIVFDTIFTSLGSTVKQVKILNRNPSAVNVSEITLAGGNLSAFSININGENAVNHKNITINAHDSINIFIKATIKPDSKTLPFIVQDSILLTTNGNKQAIRLIAYGQNAVFINASVIDKNTTWTADLPYIIDGVVTVTASSMLSILPGARLYFRKDASLNIDGRLNAIGQFDNPILFCSDRLDEVYLNEPGQWKGIYFRQLGTGIIKYATIKNALVGLTSDSLSGNANTKLILANSIIKNMQVAGYVGYHSELVALNNLFYNCGKYLVYGVGGGNYNLKQNTFAGYNLNFPRKTASVSFSDYQSAGTTNALSLNLTNNIIWGSLINEFEIERKTNAVLQSNLFNNLIKTVNTSYANNGNILNLDPGFISPGLENFELLATSPAIKKGLNLSSDVFFSNYLNRDLKNTLRAFPSSMGCYEKK